MSFRQRPYILTRPFVIVCPTTLDRICSRNYYDPDISGSYRTFLDCSPVFGNSMDATIDRRIGLMMPRKKTQTETPAEFS